MSIWNDVFEAYLDADDQFDLSDDADQQMPDNSKIPVPKAIYVYIQLDDATGTFPSNVNPGSKTRPQTDISSVEKQLSSIEQQYEALVAHFGKEAVEAAKRALKDKRRSSDSEDAPQTD